MSKLAGPRCLNHLLFFCFQAARNHASLTHVKITNGNLQACPWECYSYMHPMGNVSWDGTGINCYGMGMGQINMSHGQPW